MNSSSDTSPNDSTSTSTEPKRSLKDRLKSASGSGLRRSIGQVEGLTTEDEENHKRGEKALNRQTIGKIKRAFFWFLLVLVCLVTIACTAGMAYLVVVWVQGFMGDPAKLEDFVLGVGWTLLVVFATLFFERVYQRDD